jgi:endonuclease G, mitochondrial
MFYICKNFILMVKKIVLFMYIIVLFGACKSSVENPINTIPSNENYLMGNPSAATKVEANTDNYLLEKKQYVLSYNNTLGRANWVSWRLAKEWLGNTPRQDDFRPDDKLPATYYKASSGSFTGSGFDRGHLCPSADRDGSIADNSETFTMSNMMAQSPNVNQNNWAALEDYCRSLVNKGNELYIIAGGSGEGGSGSNGGTTKRIDNGKLTVPNYCWKIILIMADQSGNDVDRVAADTRVIAIRIPNKQSSGLDSWGNYRVSVRDLEASTTTGFDFFKSLPKNIQDAIETKVDNGPTK